MIVLLFIRFFNGMDVLYVIVRVWILIQYDVVIYIEVLVGNEGGIVGGEECDGVDDVFWVVDVVYGGFVLLGFVDCWVIQIDVFYVGQDDVGVDVVCCDVVNVDFLGQYVGKVYYCCF